jgi:hypothetical protein
MTLAPPFCQNNEGKTEEKDKTETDREQVLQKQKVKRKQT